MRTLDDLVLLVGRLCLAALFLPAGIGKLGNLAGFAGTLAAKGVPAPMVFAGLAAATEVIGGLLLLAGLFPRITALWLAGFTVVATVLSHLFWTFPEAAQAGQQIHFFKNVAIIGGFLMYFVAGPGAIAIGGKKAL